MEKLPPRFPISQETAVQLYFPSKDRWSPEKYRAKGAHLWHYTIIFKQKTRCSCICISSLRHVLGSLITYFHELKTQERGIKDEAAECEERTNVRNLEESLIQARWESAIFGGFASLSSAGIKAGRNINALKLQRRMKPLMSVLHCRCGSGASLGAVRGRSCDTTNFQCPQISQ